MAEPVVVTVDVRADGFSVTARGPSWLDSARAAAAAAMVIRPAVSPIARDRRDRELERKVAALAESIKRLELALVESAAALAALERIEGLLNRSSTANGALRVVGV